MKMRHIISVGVGVLMTMAMLSGCGGSGAESEPLSDGAALSTVTSRWNTVEAHSVTKKRTSAATSRTTTATRTSATGGASSTAARSSGTQSTRSQGQNKPVGNSTNHTPSSTATVAPQGPAYYNDLEVVGAFTDQATLCRFDDRLYKLDVPDTAVFFIKLTDDEWAIVDTATTPKDVNSYIIPAAARLGIDTNRIVGILLTHEHQDHAGGLATLLPKCPNATVYGVNAANSVAGSRYQSIADGSSLFDGVIKMVTLRGHAAEACGYYDTRSKTVMTGDSIQFYGVGVYGCQLYGGVVEYEASMAKLKGMVEDGTIENILTTHQYVPVSAVAKGRAASLEYMSIAQVCYEDLKGYTIDKYQNGTYSADAIMRDFIADHKREYPDFPTGYFNNTMNHIINQYCR